ncbi:hypothetical protein EUBDOL_01347 [Amedibacillus dolichus DSM 3991]|uniref:Uncharacterized protein n=1 Tax=Amedibacillus dolichus DSM 3991 TaxID=428127 RepID=A8RCC6_9FIRM|nr:hypothetical protein EUBDOL_01347 [Amedibacillus dolichus DSM 3991]
MLIVLFMQVKKLDYGFYKTFYNEEKPHSILCGSS